MAISKKVILNVVSEFVADDEANAARVIDFVRSAWTRFLAELKVNVPPEGVKAEVKHEDLPPPPPPPPPPAGEVKTTLPEPPLPVGPVRPKSPDRPELKPEGPNATPPVPDDVGKKAR